MERGGYKLQQYVCRSCRGVSLPKNQSIVPARARTLHTTKSTFPHSSALQSIQNPVRVSSGSTQPKRYKSTASLKAPRSSPDAQVKEDVDVDALDRESGALLATVLSVPSEEQCDAFMAKLESAAQLLADAHELDTPDTTVPSGKDTLTATNAILSLDARTKERTGARRKPAAAPGYVKDKVNALSILAYRFITHQNVFITASCLARYVKLQALLSAPDSFPEVFDQFAVKPRPSTQSSGGIVTYKEVNPRLPNSAIPADTATLALTSALHVRKLSLALSVIITSFQQKAFQRAKIVRKAVPPLMGVALLPIALWTAATKAAAIQTGIDPGMFKEMAFAGFATYLGAVGTIGYVAITSANDQMRRVTWAPGMPLAERWVREEERAAVDRVVCAWGFADKRRWGEEEGEQWEELREWAGLHGFVVDSTSLMEGMQ